MGQGNSHQHIERNGSYKRSSRSSSRSSYDRGGDKEGGCCSPLGEIYLSLTYQPSVSRLSIHVHKAKDLTSKDLVGGSDPYAKIWLLLNGHKVEKKKTAVISSTLQPAWDEAFHFSVSNEKIRTAGLHITIVDYDRVGRNDFLGEVVLSGQACSGPLESTHWREMLAASGEAVSRWHYLKDSPS